MGQSSGKSRELTRNHLIGYKELASHGIQVAKVSVNDLGAMGFPQAIHHQAGRIIQLINMIFADSAVVVSFFPVSGMGEISNI